MKIFISWSGTKSHRVALVLKEWLPKVIQSLEPYVSSENIDKGARWSTDIATELESSNFGILCVTKDNIEAPWLLFEAGALSKSISKARVTPFFFDIKGSEITKSPILQFQATVYQKDDIRKLLMTINNDCDESHLDENQLNETFDLWYPRLDEKLKEIKQIDTEAVSAKDKKSEEKHHAEVLEEILNVVRTNQVILKSPDPKIDEKFDDLRLTLKQQVLRTERFIGSGRTNIDRLHPGFIYDLLESQHEYGVIIVLSLFKADFPWIYEAGLKLVESLKSKVTISTKDRAVRKFVDLTEFTFHHPAMHEFLGYNEKRNMYLFEITRILLEYLSKNYFK